MAVIEYLGGVCVQCSYDNIRALHIDHINGDGWKERKRSNWNHDRFTAQILRGLYDGKVQLLCANCHALKSWHEQSPYRQISR